MAEVNIPEGYGIPLANLSTGELPGPTMGALDARFSPATGPVRRTSGFVVMGDSISSDGGSVYGHAWHYQLAQLSHQVMRHRGVFAAGGYTLQQMEDKYLPQVLAMNPKPQVCIIQGGTNNTSGSEADALASHERIRNALLAAGITPGLWLLCPRSDNATVRDRTTRWNAIMQTLAADNGWPIIDAYTPLVDPATGAWKAGTNLNSDHVHPNRLGHTYIAQYVAQDPRARSFFLDTPPVIAWSNVDTSNLAQNALAIGDSNADGLANQWSSYGSPTRSLHPAAVGNWQRMSLAASSNPNGGIRNISVAVTPGHVYEVAVLAHVDMDPDAPNVRYVASISHRAGTTTVRTDTMIDLGGVLDTYAVGYRRGVIPATTTSIWIDIAFNNNSTQTTREVYGEISQLLIRDLTALGLA